MNLKNEKIIVFGAGLVGSLYALMMAKLGYEVEIFEKRADPRLGFSGRARSINLALSKRGLKALELAGINEKVKELCIPMNGRMVHLEEGVENLQPYSQYGDFINSVSRNFLNELLIDEAEKTGKCIFHFEAQLLPCPSPDSMPEVLLKSDEKVKPKGDFYLGTDGANSISRTYIKGCRFSVDKISHQYKEIEIPAENGKHKLLTNALHIWPRGNFMFIALPNLDGSFTGTLFLGEMGEVSFDNLRTKEDIKQFFQNFFPEIMDLVPNYLEEFLDNPTSNLATVWADDWYDEEKNIGIIGDASHGVVPFYGQGMNSGFEDCSILFEQVKAFGLKGHFKKFAETRKKDADALAYLSMGNFIEMRDLVANPDFILQKKLEAKIQKYFPKLWMPLYSMVSFSDIPYSTVYERSVLQQQLMDELMKEGKGSELLESDMSDPKWLNFIDKLGEF